MKAAYNIATAADTFALAGAQALAVSGVRAGQTFETDDWVADEVPVALEYNGISHAVMLATPLDLEDFALGFSLSEGIVESTAELRGFEQTESPLGITLHLEVSSAAFMRLKTRRRSLAGRTGCGLCGVESLEQAGRELPPLLPSQRGHVARAAVARAMRELPSWQILQQATGAVHAAGWCSVAGELLVVREDVGRHNALDKLIGAMAIERRMAPGGYVVDRHHGLGVVGGVSGRVAQPEHLLSGDGDGGGFFIVTSRASFEMVQKTISAGIGVLAAVSAPTALAVRTAQRAGLTLAGFARGGSLSVYSHPERLAL